MAGTNLTDADVQVLADAMTPSRRGNSRHATNSSIMELRYLLMAIFLAVALTLLHSLFGNPSITDAGATALATMLCTNSTLTTLECEPFRCLYFPSPQRPDLPTQLVVDKHHRHWLYLSGESPGVQHGDEDP